MSSPVAEVIPRPMRGVIAGVHWASDVAAVLSALVSMAIMVGITTDVVGRTLTGGSVPGMLELVETFMVLVVYLALAEGERNKVHIRLELVTERLAVRLRYTVRAVAMAVATFGTGLFIYATARRALDSISFFEYRPGLLNFPVWPARIVITVGFVLLLLETLVRLYEDVVLIRHPRLAPAESPEQPGAEAV